MVPFRFLSLRGTSWLCLAFPELLARVLALAAGVGGHMLLPKAGLAPLLAPKLLHGGPC